MIIILKRDDLPEEHRHRALKDLELYHSGLSMYLVDKAELIVYVEGYQVKFLKHFPEIQSQDSLDVLTRYITTTAPTTGTVRHLSKKRVIPRKNIE